VNRTQAQAQEHRQQEQQQEQEHQQEQQQEKQKEQHKEQQQQQQQQEHQQGQQLKAHDTPNAPAAGGVPGLGSAPFIPPQPLIVQALSAGTSFWPMAWTSLSSQERTAVIALLSLLLIPERPRFTPPANLTTCPQSCTAHCPANVPPGKSNALQMGIATAAAGALQALYKNAGKGLTAGEVEALLRSLADALNSNSTAFSTSSSSRIAQQELQQQGQERQQQQQEHQQQQQEHQQQLQEQEELQLAGMQSQLLVLLLRSCTSIVIDHRKDWGSQASSMAESVRRLLAFGAHAQVPLQVLGQSRLASYHNSDFCEYP
jgi:hypothetical protein